MVSREQVRGRYTCEGDWYTFKHESDDGYDTVEWARGVKCHPCFQRREGSRRSIRRLNGLWVRGKGKPMVRVFPTVGIQNMKSARLIRTTN